MKYRKIKIIKRRKKNFFRHSVFHIILFLFLFISFVIFYKIIFFYLKKVKIKKNASTKVCICMIAKKENLYIQEFIDHYKNLSYDHIFIYDNNDIDNERFEDVIQKEIDKGFVSIINLRGYKETPQFKAFIDCYEKNNKNYDWLSFFDTDEYLVLKPENIKIQQYLNQERFKHCQNVKFNWIVFTDNDQLHYENKSLQKRFTKFLMRNYANIHVKSTVRGNLPTNYWVNTSNPHSGVNNYNCCDPSGKQISSTSPYNGRINYRYGYIKHYTTKTVEEFVNKMKRGRPTVKINYLVAIRGFFGINKKTKEKLDIFKKAFNISFRL